jgi:hypothetical protein
MDRLTTREHVPDTHWQSWTTATHEDNNIFMTVRRRNWRGQPIIIVPAKRSASRDEDNLFAPAERAMTADA